jgi:hypothetical protein
MFATLLQHMAAPAHWAGFPRLGDHLGFLDDRFSGHFEVSLEVTLSQAAARLKIAIRPTTKDQHAALTFWTGLRNLPFNRFDNDVICLRQFDQELRRFVADREEPDLPSGTGHGDIEQAPFLSEGEGVRCQHGHLQDRIVFNLARETPRAFDDVEDEEVVGLTC